MQRIQRIITLGAGSAGLIAAISLKRKIPELAIQVVRDPALGVIGVGEGTTPNFPQHFFNYLGINRKAFYQLAKPTWKLGIRFKWGPRRSFNYCFDHLLDAQVPNLPLPCGFYCDEHFQGLNLTDAMMCADKVFTKQPNGCPEVHNSHGFHIENEHLVHALEQIAKELKVEIVDGKMESATRTPEGDIESIHLSDGRKLEADFYIDASGFRSELIGKVLDEPYVSFNKSLFCDRAVVAGWDRTDEPILPYTSAETMNSGWAWQIEHQHRINRGYVYASDFISDDAAAEEFLRKNPKIKTDPRIVKFNSGHIRRQWVKNVVAIGNSGGFVEPLEATALTLICGFAQDLVISLQHSQLAPTPTIRDLFNRMTEASWNDIRDFLALHYKLNTADHTPFWKHCQNDTDVSQLSDFLEFYEQNGPTGLCRYSLPHTHSDFGPEGYLVMMVGNRVPYKNRHTPSQAELAIWQRYLNECQTAAKQAMTVEESLKYVQDPRWQWHGDVQSNNQQTTAAR